MTSAPVTVQEEAIWWVLLRLYF